VNSRAILLPLIPLLVILIALETLSKQGVIPEYLLPAPSQVAAAWKESPQDFLNAFQETTWASGLGLLLSVVFGLGAGLLMTFSKTLRDLFYPYALFFQTVPIIAIAPLLVIWLGYGMPTVVASSWIVAVFPMVANSVMGLTNTEIALVQLFRLQGASKLQELFLLRLPSAVPSILGGFKISAGLAVIGAIVGEFISGSGLGGLIDSARNQQRVDRVFAAVLLAAVLGILFFSLVSVLNKKLLAHWKEPTA
jgi:NitT/TauT family transport system permease protein